MYFNIYLFEISSYYLFHSFFSLANCWNFETVIKSSSVANNKFHLFSCVRATHFNSKILRVTVFQYFILTDIWKFSLQNYRNPYFLTYLSSSESQIISNFASCRFHIHFPHVSGASYMPAVVWSSMADPSACHCRRVQKNHSPKACGSRRQLSCEEQKKHPFGIEASIGGRLLSYLLCFVSLLYMCRLHFFPPPNWVHCHLCNFRAADQKWSSMWNMDALCQAGACQLYLVCFSQYFRLVPPAKMS